MANEPWAGWVDADGNPLGDAIRAAGQRRREMAAVFAANAAVTEAELAVRGIFPVSVVHGDPESERDMARLRQLSELADRCGTVRITMGGGDWRTYLFEGPGAEQAALAFLAGADAIAGSWWRVTPTATPEWH